MTVVTETCVLGALVKAESAARTCVSPASGKEMPRQVSETSVKAPDPVTEATRRLQPYEWAR